MKYFSSDWHLGHSGIISFGGRPFEDVVKMNEVIIENMVSPLKRGDEFYFLGDFYWKEIYFYEFMKRFPFGVKFHWILGNHDSMSNEVKNFNKINSIDRILDIKINGNKTTLCHFPMVTWNCSHYNAFHLYGHHHNNETSNIKTQGKTLNVNCEFNNFLPYNEDQIVEIMSKKPDNFDLIIK